MAKSSRNPDFVVVEPLRTSCIYFSRALDRVGRLRLHCIGTRRGVDGVPPAVTRLKPAVGLVAYAGAKLLSPYRAESFRFSLHPWLDRWANRQLCSGDHVISSYGYANECFSTARARGGKTFLDAGNSHPDNFWQIMSEELLRWKSPYLPIARHHYDRSLAMLEQTDYILAPSSFVARSFLDRGFAFNRVIQNSYPVNLKCFSPRTGPRPPERPITIISTGRLSLRKGTPYLLEAFRLIWKRHPSARFLLTSGFESNIRPILARYSDLPIDWSPPLPHPKLAERLRSADVFLLPSLEDGFAVTVAEALACGLPVVTTANTGASDLVIAGKNGSVVPIRNAESLAEATLLWADRVLAQDSGVQSNFDPGVLETQRFELQFLEDLAKLGLP